VSLLQQHLGAGSTHTSATTIFDSDPTSSSSQPLPSSTTVPLSANANSTKVLNNGKNKEVSTAEEFSATNQNQN
jgi:hypothetical protein